MSPVGALRERYYRMGMPRRRASGAILRCRVAVPSPAA